MERIFVRSKWEITYDTPQATGNRLTESECISEFGKEQWESMLEEKWMSAAQRFFHLL